ncbi:MAG: hypothetical protein M3011_05265 [Actinomycetota bacterium]|nr:hypothetical protein [Actinomycetota bacterium]
MGKPNVHGYGDTLAEARRNIRDAITTLFGPFGAAGDAFDLVEDIRLPDGVLEVVSLGRLQRKRAGRQLAEARAAEESATSLSREAAAVTRQAGRMLVEHGILVEARADDFGLTDDVRLPEAVMVAIERAHQERQTANRQRRAALLAREEATARSGEALSTNREAARLLVEECGLTAAESAGLLGLSPERTQRLLE